MSSQNININGAKSHRIIKEATQPITKIIKIIKIVIMSQPVKKYLLRIDRFRLSFVISLKYRSFRIVERIKSIVFRGKTML